MPDQEDSIAPSKSPRPLRRWSIGLSVLLQIVLVFTLFFLANYAGYRHYARRDLSPGKNYSLGETTVGWLRKVNKDVSLTLIFTRSSDTINDARALLEEIRLVKRNRIHVEEIDPARDLERAEELKLQNNITLHGNGILVRAAGRVRFIGEEELLVPGTDGDRNNPSVDFRGEDAVLSAIINLIEGGTRKFYFVTGKGGARDQASEFTALADIGRRQNIDVAKLDLAEISAIPPGTDGLVLAGPGYDLSERELALLQAYWDGKRSSLLVLLNPNADTPRLRGFLAANGAQPRSDRVLFAESTSAGPRKEFSVQAVFRSDSPISRPFVNASTRLSGQSQSLNLLGNTAEFRAKHIEVTPLLDAAERYWGESRYDSFDDLPVRDAADTKPPVHLAASVERGAVADERLRVDSPRMVVIGNDTLLNPATRLAVDQDFISSSINWMLNRERLIGPTPKRKAFFRIQLTDDQRRQIFQTTVIMLPGIALLLGFLVWAHRRS